MRLIIAGGGTGGHLFPGVAVAEEVMARDPESSVLFVGTARGIEARVIPRLGMQLALIDATGLKTVGAFGALRGLLRVPRAIWQSRKIVREFKPDAVIGVGGYASGPLVLAAWMAGVPTAILEQNSIPGLANKILGKIVRAVFLAFEETRRFFRPQKIIMSGNPIRRQLLDRLARTPNENFPPPPPGGWELSYRSDTDAPAREFRVFAFGGSLGAKAVNTLVVDAAAVLHQTGERVCFVHQTGTAEREPTLARYRAAQIPDAQTDVREFIDDMASEYARADLVIARAGATTVAELTCVGVPAILIPYPTAADNHQERNAEALADAGAALLYRQADLTGESLAAAIRGLMKQPDRLGRMQSAMRSLGRPEAAKAIVDWLDQASKSRRKSDVPQA